MASRQQQKAHARERRLEQERTAAASRQRTRRRQLAGGVVGLAAVIVAALVLISSGGGPPARATLSGAQARATTAAVDRLLKGIPQSGETLGRPEAPVTVTEYADLECPYCREFAVGDENTLIDRDVRAGRVKLVYRSLSTATFNGPESGVFTAQQSAAAAAGAQNRAWNYIETFYREQRSEDSVYVTPSFLTSLARQVSGLKVARWQHDRTASHYATQVQSDALAARRLGFQTTPTFVVSGPVSQARPVSTLSYTKLESLIRSVAP